MNNRNLIISRIYLTVFILLPVFLFGQLGFDPQITGMANSIGAAARGIRASEVNPALLAMPFSKTSQLSLMTIQVNATNNALSNSNYIKYFTKGKYLNETDKANILKLIPSTGLRASTDTKLNLLGLYSNNLAFNFFIVGSGDATIPKNFFDLMFNGNDFNKVYEFTDLKGEAWFGMSTTLSYGMKFEPYEVIDVPLLGDMDYWSVGLTAKYIYGFLYTKATTSTAQFSTFDNYVDARFLGTRYESQGGNGYGFDVGWAVSFEENKYVLSLGFKNLMGGIAWNNKNKEITYEAYLDSVSISNISGEDLSVQNIDTLAFRSFYTYLPTYLDLGFSYQPNSELLFTFEYEQGLRSSMGATKRPRFGVGSELRYFPVVPMRFGLSLGGIYGISMGTGFSIDLGAWVWDFGIANHGGFFGNSAKGLSAATGMTFQW